MNVLKTNNRFSSLLEDNRPVHTRHVGASRYINKFKTDTKINHANINMNDFPALIDARANAKVDDVKPNYVTTLLHQTTIEPEKEEVLPYGWIVITPNKFKHQCPITPPKPSWENAMDSLVKLYNKRKDEYIAMWGEETYEKVFLFPNNDYDYDYYEDEDDEDYDDDDDDGEYEYEYDKYYN
jgi:hypothetical protein